MVNSSTCRVSTNINMGTGWAYHVSRREREKRERRGGRYSASLHSARAVRQQLWWEGCVCVFQSVTETEPSSACSSEREDDFPVFSRRHQYRAAGRWSILHAAFRSCELPNSGAIMCFCFVLFFSPCRLSAWILSGNGYLSKERAPGTGGETAVVRSTPSLPTSIRSTPLWSCGLAGPFSISCTSLPEHPTPFRTGYFPLCCQF